MSEGDPDHTTLSTTKQTSIETRLPLLESPGAKRGEGVCLATGLALPSAGKVLEAKESITGLLDSVGQQEGIIQLRKAHSQPRYPDLSCNSNEKADGDLTGEPFFPEDLASAGSKNADPTAKDNSAIQASSSSGVDKPTTPTLGGQ